MVSRRRGRSAVGCNRPGSDEMPHVAWICFERLSIFIFVFDSSRITADTLRLAEYDFGVMGFVI